MKEALVAGFVAGCASASLLAAPTAAGANVGTLVEVELFKLFEPTKYSNTCEGVDAGASFGAGSIFFFGDPRAETRPIDEPIGTAQMQSAELTDHGTCLIQYVGTAPNPPGNWSRTRTDILIRFQVSDPFGESSGSYLAPVPVQPISRPDLPSISQRVYIAMYAQVEQ